MKILNDEGPLRVEDDEEDSMRVVHKSSSTVKRVYSYLPGSIVSWSESFARARGFQEGWEARKVSEYAKIVGEK